MRDLPTATTLCAKFLPGHRSETVDLSLTDDIPSVLDVLRALQPCFVIGSAWMAQEFREHNPRALQRDFEQLLPQLQFESYLQLKQRVPNASGLIRTTGTGAIL